jgi:hypothetical protein
MKKFIIFLALLAIPTISCFAGSFYSNIVILSIKNEKVLPVLLQMGLTAYYVFKNDITVVFEEKIDEQDIEYGMSLTAKLSKDLNTIAVYSINHDSDVLVIDIYKNGQLIFLYNSDPGYFTDEDIPPQIEKIDELLMEYKNIDKNEFMDILTTEEVFADDIHIKIVELLVLPPYSVGYGYNYIEEVETREYMENEYKIKIEKIIHRENLEMFNRKFILKIILCVVIIFGIFIGGLLLNI